MSDRVTKASKKIELPIIKGKASEVLRDSPLSSSVASSTRQVAGDSEFKKIPSILDNILIYAKKPIDRTVDISINTQVEETYESLDNTNGLIGLSTKHVEDHNKLLKDIIEVIKDDDSDGGGSILDGLFGSRKPKPAATKPKPTPKPAPKPAPAPKPPVSPARPAVPQVTAPPATSVAKPPVSPARPTVPQVTAPPATSVAKPPSVLSSITEKIKSLKPSVSNIISGATSIGKGLATGAATDVALSSLTGRDEGLSSLALGFVPAAAGTVIATSGIKQAFAAAEALTPEERKGVDVRPETLDKILKKELNIEIVNEKELAPFKAGQVVSAQTIAKEYDISSLEELRATIESLIKSGSGSNIKVKITTESEKEKDTTPPAPDAIKIETPPAAASAQSQQTQQTQPAESIDRNKLIDRLKTVSSKIQNKDERTLNRLENITMMIQNNQLNEASAAIDRMEKSLSSTQEKPISDAFKDRQNTPSPTPGQRRSSLPDGSYQVASAQTTMTDATYITDEPEVKLASDIKTTGKNIVDPTGKSALVINETVKDINDGQIQTATASVDKLKTEIKEQNKAYETLNDVMHYFGIKKKVADQTKIDTSTEDTPDTPDTTPQVQATQNIQQPQSQAAQAPVSSGFSSGFSKMAGLAASFMGATAASRSSSGGANGISAGSMSGGVTGSMMQPQLSSGSVTSTSGAASAVSGPAANNSASSSSDQSKGGGQPSGDFMTEVGKVASNLSIDASNLIAIMKSESGLNPQAINPSSGASGLIQFMPTTAKSLGTTVEEIRKMTAVQQLPYVEKYFKSVRVQPGSSAGRLYAYVFLPGRANREVLTQAGENYYESNKGLDIDRDGKITIADLDARLAKYGGSTSASLQGAKPASGSSLSVAGTSMEASDQAQMRSPGQALQGTTASSPSAGSQGMQMLAGAMGMGEIPINIRLRQLQS